MRVEFYCFESKFPKINRCMAVYFVIVLCASRQEPVRVLPVINHAGARSSASGHRRHVMRKMILMALAGYVWRKVQSRVVKRAVSGRSVHRPH
jgi:hypothetical protein